MTMQTDDAAVGSPDTAQTNDESNSSTSNVAERLDSIDNLVLVQEIYPEFESLRMLIHENHNSLTEQMSAYQSQLQALFNHIELHNKYQEWQLQQLWQQQQWLLMGGMSPLTSPWQGSSFPNLFARTSSAPPVAPPPLNGANVPPPPAPTVSPPAPAPATTTTASNGPKPPARSAPSKAAYPPLRTNYPSTMEVVEDWFGFVPSQYHKFGGLLGLERSGRSSPHFPDERFQQIRHIAHCIALQTSATYRMKTSNSDVFAVVQKHCSEKQIRHCAMLVRMYICDRNPQRGSQHSLPSMMQTLETWSPYYRSSGAGV